MHIHTVFDLLAWASGTLLGWGVRRRYLRDGALSGFKLSQHPGYLVAVALTAGIGAYLAGGGNMALADLPPLGHSIAGAILGGIVGAEGYKLFGGIRGSTGLVFVAPLAMGITIGRWGCFLTGLPDYTYGTPTALPWGVDFGQCSSMRASPCWRSSSGSSSRWSGIAEVNRIHRCCVAASIGWSDSMPCSVSAGSF
jgi:phosphatidylglycerol:prolipoprotein diacylglycerol transferase